MQLQKLGQSGLEVSGLWLGTELLGSKCEKGNCFKVVDYFHEEGGNFVDTANMYACWLPGFQGGDSETVIGQWMKERGNRNRIVLDSKLGFDYPGCHGGLTAAEIERECEKSLRRLQTDRIDLYYAHRDDRETLQNETMEAFYRLFRAGKVTAIGASSLKGRRVAAANVICPHHGCGGF